MSLIVTSLVTPASFLNDGTITLTIAPSTGTNTFSWNDGIITQNRTGLTASTYIVTVTNALDGETTTVTKTIVVASINILVDRSNVDALLPAILCCIGNKGYLKVYNAQQGYADCGDNKYAIRLTQVLKNWYPAGYVIQQGKSPYFVVSTVGMMYPNFFNITVPDGIGGSIFIYNNNANAIGGILSWINSHTIDNGFSAELNGTNLWIYAPYGYNGVTPSFTNFGAQITTYGFQGGCKQIIAQSPCINSVQVEGILEVFKKQCNLCVSTITTS